MSNYLDLDGDLRTYVSYLNTAAASAAEVDFVVGSESPVTPPSAVNRRVWVGALAALVTILLMGLIPLLTVNGDAPVANEAVATTVSELSLTPGTWSRVPGDQMAFSGSDAASMSDVTVGGPGLVSVGSRGVLGDLGAAVWTSVDGITWSRIPYDEAIFGGAEMLSVTAGGPGLVAVGGPHWYCRCDDDAAAWTSVDGITWSRVSNEDSVFGGGGNQTMNSVIAGGPGLVAVGAVGSEAGGLVDAAVWTSVDGITWSRAPDDGSVFGGKGNQRMDSVTAGGPGLVAVGRDDSIDSAVVWTSVDGVSWSRVFRDTAIFFGATMSSLTAGGPGLVAVGWDDLNDSAAVWTSVDGVAWSRAPQDESVFGGTEMRSVTAGGPGLVAVGAVPGTEQSFGSAVVWTSVDGVAWSRAPQDEAVFGGTEMRSVTAGGPGLVAVGANGSGNRGGAVWLRPRDD